MRTCDPFVDSLGVKCFVFSSNISLQAALRGCEISAQRPKLILLRSESAVCSFAYFCCCDGKCVASSCSCRQGCAGACKDLLWCAFAQCAVVRLLQYLRFVTAGSCEHLANCHACDHCSWNRMNRFCSHL